MSVEQKIPTWGVKNFKYEVGLTRRQSDFIRDKLLFKEVYSFVQFINMLYSPKADLGYFLFSSL